MGALLAERLARPVGCKLSDPRAVGMSRQLRMCLRGELQNVIECIAFFSYHECLRTVALMKFDFSFRNAFPANVKYA